MQDTKFQVKRLKLNSGGYTSKGYYYGVGMQPLYECYNENEYITLRANNRDNAIELLQYHFKDRKIKFYRGPSTNH